MTLQHHYAPQPGEQLYHYTSTAGALAILESRTLWLSDYRRMNDLNEFLYAKRRFLDAVWDRSIEVEDPVRGLAGLTVLRLERAQLMLIGCLTAQRDAAHQWSRYADNGQGCVVGVDAEFLAKDAGVAIRTVSYDAHYLWRFVRMGLLMLQHEYQQKPDDYGELITLANFFAADMFAFKEKSFESEKEVRISRMIRKDPSATLGYADVGGHDRNKRPLSALALGSRTTASGACIYLPLPLIQGLARGIRSIGFGPRCTTETRRRVEAIVKDAMPEVALWQAIG